MTKFSDKHTAFRFLVKRIEPVIPRHGSRDCHSFHFAGKDCPLHHRPPLTTTWIYRGSSCWGTANPFQDPAFPPPPRFLLLEDLHTLCTPTGISKAIILRQSRTFNLVELPRARKPRKIPLYAEKSTGS